MMNPPPHLLLDLGDWLHLFGQYLLLSVMSIGGPIATTAEMHRYLVEQHHWLTQAQFNNSIAIAQAAPGPNMLFVALMGWNVGLNAGGYGAALLGVLVTMTGILLPSTILTYLAAQWGHRNRERLGVRAFKQGMAPIVIALLAATGWILAANHKAEDHHLALWAVTAVTTVVIWKTRIHILWLLGAGAVAGWMGWI